MTEINKENLEKALQKPEENEPKQEEMSKDTEIGFHKGSITTLINERNELLKMAQNVEAIMQAHLKRLEELGVKIVKK